MACLRRMGVRARSSEKNNGKVEGAEGGSQHLS
jgi:hypothetical protein